MALSDKDLKEIDTLAKNTWKSKDGKRSYRPHRKVKTPKSYIRKPILENPVKEKTIYHHFIAKILTDGDTIETLRKKIGISHTALSNFCGPRLRKPHPRTIEKIYKFFDEHTKHRDN